jgi:hypothetical protein
VTGAATIRGRSGEPGLVGARVYPTVELNGQAGLDIQSWLNAGYLDFVIPMSYTCFVVDAQMPIDWIIEAAHEADTSVYGMLQPYFGDGRRYNTKVEHATPEMMRAAAANFWQVGVDGLYTWFLDWPLGNNERRILTDISDSEQSKEGNKHYFLRQRADAEDAFERPKDFDGAISIDDVELVVEYDVFPNSRG